MTVADNLRKLCLGTVQFGLDYGIANTSGKIVQSEVFEILRYAAAQGIDCLDTASVYGDSERVIGAFLKESPAKFKVISKWVAESGQLDPVKGIENQLRHTLQDLNLESLDGYLVHHFHDFRNHEAAWTAFAKLKQQGLIRSIGFSLYKLEDLEYLLRKKIQFDIVQIPYSVFDRRFEPFLPELKSRGVTIFVRSVFLQGLVFLDPNRLTGRLTKAAEPLRRLHAIAEEQRIAVDAICLNFPLLNPLVDKVIIGVDGLTQLKKNVQALAEVAKLKLATNALINVNCSDEDVILPQRWK